MNHQLLDILRINMIEAQFYHHLVPIYPHQCQAKFVTRGCISDRRLVRIEAFQENDLGVMVELMDSKQALFGLDWTRGVPWPGLDGLY